MTGPTRESQEGSPFASIEDAIAAMGRGEIVVVVDDEDRENEGDLIMAAEHATPEAIAFFVRHTSGVICAPLLGERLDELEIPLMVRDNTESHRTAFTYSVDLDRTARRPGSPQPTDPPPSGRLTDPAHPAPRPGASRPHLPAALQRRWRAQAGRVTPRRPSISPGWRAAIPPGCSARSSRTTAPWPGFPIWSSFCDEHGLLLISIAQLIRYRRQNEKLVRRIAEARIPTDWGDFTCYVYESVIDGEQHVAMVRGAVQGEPDVLVRVHSECLTGDVFGSMRCDCGVQLDGAMRRIAEEELGVLVYLRGHEGRGIGLGHKIRAYGLQEAGHGHGRGERGSGTAGRLAGVRHRRADPQRPRDHDDAADHEQPLEIRRSRGIRARDHRPGVDPHRRRTPRTSTTSEPRRNTWATFSKGWTDGQGRGERLPAASTARGRRVAGRDRGEPVQRRGDRAADLGCRAGPRGR